MFNNVGNIENRNGQGQPPVSGQMVQAVSSCFRHQTTATLMKSAAHNGISYLTVQNVLKMGGFTFPYNVKSLYQLQQDYVQLVPFSLSSYGENFGFDSGF